MRPSLNSSSSFALLALGVVLSLSYTVSGQSCACGFIDSNRSIWRESLVSTFTQNAGPLAAVNADWWVASDNGHLQPTGYYMQYVTENVFPNQDGLGLKTSAYDGSGVIKTAEIFTKREDIQYGTFRMQAQIPKVPGVTFGFFTYREVDLGNGQVQVQEQDIEFIHEDSEYYRTVHYTNQPSLINGDVDLDASKTVVVPGADVDFTQFRNHRFDWLPNRTLYYFDNVLTSTITKNVPTADATVHLNVWSNGDPLWSRGPPTQDAIATIYNVKLYFNSTSFDERAFNTACANAGGPALCVV